MGKVIFKDVEHNKAGRPINIEDFSSRIMDRFCELMKKYGCKDICEDSDNANKAFESDEYKKLDRLFQEWKNEFSKIFNKYHKLEESIQYLTVGSLIEALEEARFFNGKYYRTPNKEKYIYLKSIEVDGSCDLMRGGFNAEDYGVYAHWVFFGKGLGVVEKNAPIHMFTCQYYDDARNKQKWVEIDEKEFNDQLAEAVKEMIKPKDTSELKYDMDSYYNFFEERFKLNKKYNKKLDNILKQ